MDEITEKELQKILVNLRIGIAKIETGGHSNPYSATAGDKNKDGKPDSSATGKYQFLKSWLEDNNGVQGIKSFAKKSGVFNEVNDMSDFRSQPELQEAYFTYYAKEVLIPQALKTAVKNPLNLSIDEIASQFHFQPPKVAKDSIQSGNLVKETGTNASGARYINLYRKGLKDFGLKPVTFNDIIKAKEQEALDSGKEVNLSDNEKSIKKNNEKIKEQFAKKDKAISDLDIDQGSKEKLRNDLFQEAVDNGTYEIANEYIEEENQKKENEFNEYKELIDLAQKIEVNYYESDNKKGTKRRFAENAFFVNWNSEDTEQREKLREKYDFFLTKNKTGDYDNHINQEKLFKTIQKKYKNITGKEIKISPGLGGDKNKGVIDTNNFKNILSKTFGNVNRSGNLVFKDSSVTNPQLLKRTPIDPKNYIKKELPETDNNNQEDSSSSDNSSSSAKKTSTSDKVNPETKENESIDNNSLEEHLSRQLGLFSTKEQQFNYGETKQELPIDAITGLALGLIGDKQAKDANIPLRTEEVSDAVKMFTAELAQRSKQGLPVEVEAKMRNDLAESFQAGLTNVVNASAGNRASVLGNLGGLDANKNKGMVAIQMADYQAKEKAFAQYGQALMYQNDFNSRRDIANHAIEFGEAKTDQKNGRDLATAGFSKLMDALKYQKENGPGSAKDQYRSLLMQKMFGFDPKMKDDGTGDIQGTKSFFDKRKGLVSENLAKTKEMYEKFGTLNPDQKKALGLLTNETSDNKKIDGMMNFLLENPEQDLSKLSMDNLDIASKKNDYSLLSLDRDKALQPNKDVLKSNEINLSSEDLNDEGSGLADPSNPMGPLNAYPEEEKLKTPSLATNPFNTQLASMDEYYNNQ